MALQAGTADRTALRYVPEVTFNTTPTTPAFRNLRITGESVVYNISSETSNEIRPDRATADLVLTGASVEGDINFELSYESFDDLIEAALCGTWSANVVKNGTTNRSITIQKHFQDLQTPIFQNFSGCRIGTFNLDFQVGQILTGSFNVMGCTATSGTAQIVGASFSSPGAGKTPMNAVSGVTSVNKNGSPWTSYFRSLSMNLNNNPRGQEAIGTLGYIGIALGQLEISGDIELYFENATEYDTFLNNSDFSLSFDVEDPIGNKYNFKFPRVKYSKGEIVAGGRNQDLMVSASWSALYDSVAGSMVEITRTTYTP